MCENTPQPTTKLGRNGVLQCVAVCSCGTLKCFSVCCSVVQFDA